jgi:predicted ATPase/DNA-binding CsgD family transcriptional regulator
MPPTAPVARAPGQLPVETTGFVGRRSELVTLGTLLGGSRLVTVTGPGGVGKTRLALRAASEAAPRYKHGAVLAELSAVRDPGLLPHTVAVALGLLQRGPGPGLEAITGYLRARELLLILDTCEHLVEECALFAGALLREAPGVTILATSRQPLDAPGESTCPLSPLQVPEEGGTLNPGDATELFAQRAAAARAGFAVTDANRARVIELCRRLDGIPLAIELAAVRLRALDLDELGRRLDKRMQILTGVRRGTTPRHQALRDTIGWSYDLCTPQEQALWARLSVFAGPFTVAAAEDTCAGGELPRGDVLATLIALVDKSVLIKDDGPVPCYRMLDTIREYCAGRLGQAGDTDRVRILMTGHYLRLAAELDADPLTGQLARYRVMRAQRDNIRAALGYGFEVPGAAREGARLVAALYWYTLISGEFSEARHWLARLLERFREPSAERAAGLLLQGLLATAQGTPVSGLAECEDGLRMAGGLGDARLYARGHLYYCMTLLVAGRPEESATTARIADSLMRAAGDVPNAEVLHLYIALTHLLTGDLDRCYAACTQGLRRISPDSGERWTSSFLLAMAGAVLFLRGEPESGVKAARRFLEMRRELGDSMGMAFGLSLLGIMAANQGKFRRTAWLMGGASQVWERLGTATFTGVAGLDELARAAADETRKAMGEDAYTETFSAAAKCSLDELTIAETGDLSAPAPGGADAPRVSLTGREREIAGLVAQGMSNREIAEHLVISKRTVDSHVEHIFGKLAITSRVQLTAWVTRHLTR